MPEYLAPGVYVEEVSYRTRSIEGVGTTTAGFVGPTRTGPLHDALEVITSLSEYERTYGDGQPLAFDDATVDNWMWHAARAFFIEGGSRLYVKRIFNEGGPAGRASTVVGDSTHAFTVAARDPGAAGNLHVTFSVHAGQSVLAGTAAGPVVHGLSDRDLVLVSDDGTVGATHVAIATSALSPDGTRTWSFDPGGPPTNRIELASLDPAVAVVRAVTVTVSASSPADPAGAETRSGLPLDPAHTRGGAPDSLSATFARGAAGRGTPIVIEPAPGDDGRDVLAALDAASDPLGPAAKAGHLELKHGSAVVMDVVANTPGDWSDALAITVAKVGTGDRRTVTLSNGGVSVFSAPYDSVAELVDALADTLLVTGVPKAGTWPIDAIAATNLDGGDDDSANAPTLTKALIAGDPVERRSVSVVLQGGSDGARPTAADYEGAVLPDDSKTGLVAFEDLDDVSVVAAPGCTYGYASREDDARACIGALLAHARRMRYRIAVVDCGNDQTIADVRALRAKLDSSYGALYYPWITFVDPVSGLTSVMPPSGAIAGIYARNDVNRGVHKAPANEVVTVATGFERVLSRSQQEVLNPEGINCLRSFPGRGNRVWGARLLASDPEWKYVNLRRYFAFLEHSIDRGTQWAVFEPNGERLWASVRGTIEDYLLDQWQTGALLGDKPEKAYFVRCDRSTMTQNDLDNGRLVCQIGVAPLRPAEFVIFRIGQWTADRKL